MCLRVDKSVKAKKPNSLGYCVGWKLMTKFHNAIYSCGDYKLGLNTSNRQNKSHGCDTGLNDDQIHYKQEMHRNLVAKGYHLFLKRDDARYLKKISILEDELEEGLIIVKVYYKPEDVVAYGKCSIHSNSIDLDPVSIERISEEDLQDLKLSKMDNVVVMRMKIDSFKNN